MSNLFSKAVSGLKWSSLSSFGIVLSQFTLGVILARLLSPEEYGLVAMVMIIIVYANLLVNFGFSVVLVQRKDVDNDQFSTVFWINSILGIVLCLFFAAVAPNIAQFYDRKIIVTLVYFLAPILVINSLGICHRVKLERALNFKPIAIAEISSVVLSTSIAIIMALNGYGVWSLVAQALIKSVVNSVILWFSSGWMPKWIMTLSSLKGMWNLTSVVMTNNLAEGFAGSMDRVIIGKVEGSQDLGAYEKAKQLMLMPTQLISGVISRVLLPSLSKLQEQPTKFAKAYKQIFGAVALVVFPMIFGLNFIAEDMILLLFGDQWKSMVQLFEIICWAGLFTVLNVMADNIIIASGNTKGLLKITLIEKPFLVALFFIGILWGANGVAWSYVVGAIVIFVYKTFVATQPLVLRLIDMIRALVGPLMLSVIMYLLLAGVHYFFGQNFSLFTALIIYVAVGLLVYVPMALSFQREKINFLARIINDGR